jgi:hypothetical protein
MASIRSVVSSEKRCKLFAMIYSRIFFARKSPLDESIENSESGYMDGPNGAVV